MQDLKVTLIQADLDWEKIEANLEMFDASIDAIAEPCDLIVLPEMFSTGFSMSAETLAEPMSGKAVTWMQAKAQASKTVITGSLIIGQSDKFYNRLVWARPDGSLATYDKKHLFRYADEDSVYTAGGERITMDLKGWRVRPFICYDLRFPIWCRNLDLAYDLALFVANWPARRSAHWRKLLVARAIENQSYVIGVNRVGIDGNGHAYDGASAIINPLGEAVFEGTDKAITQTATLSYRQLADYRKAFPAWKDADSDLVI
ncbi:MAG: amidohydrolase [Desulfobacteraceae bacterium]|jgi:predicted amidohydrolase